MTIRPAPAQDPLQEAVRHLNAGAHAQAVASLRVALAAAPDHPVALTLMGAAQIEAGDVDDAERHLRRALAVSPGRPEILHYLAKAARMGGRPAEAVSLCQAALSQVPDYDDALVELAAAHVATGSFEDALALQRRLITRHPKEIGLRRSLAATLLRTGRSVETEQALREALMLAPGDAAALADVHSDLADILKTRRAFDEAATHYAAAARSDRGARPHKGRAAVLQHLRRFDEAVDALKASVLSDPLDMDAHLQLNELLFRQGRDEDFLRSYDEAASLRAESTIPLVAKGQLLLKIGDAAAAERYFDQALRRSPEDPGGLVGRARALEALGMADRARSAYERALRMAPDDPAAFIDMSSFLLRNGEPDRAQDHVRRVLGVQPHSQEALALSILCYRALGDEREFALAGYDTLVRSFDLEAPPGFKDMEAFNRELAGYLDGLHGDVREHFTQTLRGGTRLYDAVLQNGHALVDRLKPAIDRAVAHYIRELSRAAPDAFVDRRASGFGYRASWSSQIAERGFHLNHIHPEGWISSVYYVAVPDVCTNDMSREGWLKFGEPTADFGSGYSPRRFVEPRPGRLVLFPSYLWHGTTPFAAAQSRMTIAFDIVPGGVRAGLDL